MFNTLQWVHLMQIHVREDLCINISRMEMDVGHTECLLTRETELMLYPIYKVIKIIKEIILSIWPQKNFLQCFKFNSLMTIFFHFHLCIMILLFRVRLSRILPTTGAREQSQPILLPPRSRFLLTLRSRDSLFFLGRTEWVGGRQQNW